MLKDMNEAITRFWVKVKTEQAAATAVEYALMVALIAAVIVAAVIFLGRETSETFSRTGSNVSTS